MMQQPQHEVREIQNGVWGIGGFDHVDMDRLIAVTGGRDTTPYGDRVAASLGHDFASHGWHVVSGGGFGIDAAAVRGALTVGATPPIVWAASSFDAPYPRANASLFDQVIEAGGMILTGTNPSLGTTHPTRATLIARSDAMLAQAKAVVLVESSHRSAACPAATRTTSPVFGVPGPIDSLASIGVNQLIRSGHAQLITGTQDMLAALKGRG